MSRRLHTPSASAIWHTSPPCSANNLESHQPNILSKISRLKQRYENARNELEEKFPTVPPKPDKVAIMREIKRKFGKRQINLLINDTKDLDFEGKEFMLNKIKNSSAKRNEYWKMKPDDPNDPNAGKNAEMAAV